jgi:hypothetical protein
MEEDLTYGQDSRGDNAFFIEEFHFTDKGWGLDAETKKFLSGKNNATFFRVIRNGIEQRGHGWIEAGEIIQWG